MSAGKRDLSIEHSHIVMAFMTRLATSALALCGLAGAASLEQVTNFGSNPAGVEMFIYVPDSLLPNPSVIFAMHQCTGSAEEYFSSTTYDQTAEQYNYILVFPQSPYSGTCFDVSSTATLTHDGGGDSNSIATMAQYVIETYSADASRVYMTGSSSGAMMVVSPRAAKPLPWERTQGPPPQEIEPYYGWEG